MARAGCDIFVFSVLPTSEGNVQDFTPGDMLDFRQLFSAIGYTGTNPDADGYIRFPLDSAGDTKAFDAEASATAQPVLVTTPDHVLPLQMQSEWVLCLNVFLSCQDPLRRR
jgi:hypothetical protein